MTVERTQLPCSLPDTTNPYRVNVGNPTATGGSPDNDDPPNISRAATLSRDTEKENEEEARFYAKLASRTQSQPSYFANRRANQLLIDAAALSSGVNRPINLNSSNVHSASHFGMASSASEPSSLLAHSIMGALPGAFDDVLNNKRQTRLRNSQSSALSKPQYSPSCREPR
ncbi:hypothetical protein PHET_09059 [Paragonimus heterotremus]|uniref:Uncharacterized protein n=1 Tax=Paragonimus heterotremus TaxID=100268 RepID=A0A8J4SHH7_9TREM|nr:hypothetical protein PHET_09059 [Paragonimus heterotremus]